MDSSNLSKLSKQELLQKCEEYGINKCKSKNKTELITLIQNKFENNNEIKNVTNKPINNSIPKPILKWVGGKTQIIDKIISNFPKEINNYHEIFLGGGSVLIALLHSVNINKITLHGKIYAYDINESLIYVYKNIQTNPKELYYKLKEIIQEYNDIEDSNESDTKNRNPKNIKEAKSSKESYYYWTRSVYNSLNKEEKMSILGSAMFIFLNKTCFRGVYREGPNGFNVPYGHYKNPEIINKEHLDEIHNLIKNVIFECCDYSKSLLNIEDNDFIYLDPPYAPENSKSFVGYTKNGFDENNHLNLFKMINELNDKKTKNIKTMMSNSDVEIVHNNFPESKYNTETIICKRSINSTNPESKTNEVIIKNY